MICDHLRPLEQRILSRRFLESRRSSLRQTNCRERVTYSCDAEVIAKLEGISLPPCVKHYEHSDPDFGTEGGLVCEEHHHELISGLLSGAAEPAFMGIESTASPDGLLEAAYLVRGDYDRGPTTRCPRIIRIATSEVLVDLLVMLTTSLAFVASALWIIAARPPEAPIVAAWFGVVFFGACALFAAKDLRRSKPPQ